MFALETMRSVVGAYWKERERIPSNKGTGHNGQVIICTYFYAPPDHGPHVKHLCAHLHNVFHAGKRYKMRSTAYQGVLKSSSAQEVRALGGQIPC